MRAFVRVQWAAWLLCVSWGGPLFGDEARAKDEAAAKKVVSDLSDRLKAGKIDDAFQLFATVPRIPKSALGKHRQKLEGLSKPIAAGDRKMIAEDSKAAGDCAVVVVWERKSDYDPFFLVKKDGQWQILFTVTRFNERELGLSDDQIKRFSELQGWFEERKKALQKSSPRTEK